MKKIKISEKEFEELEERVKKFIKILEPLLDIFKDVVTILLKSIPPELLELAKEMEKWEK